MFISPKLLGVLESVSPQFFSRKGTTFDVGRWRNFQEFLLKVGLEKNGERKPPVIWGSSPPQQTKEWWHPWHPLILFWSSKRKTIHIRNTLERQGWNFFRSRNPIGSSLEVHGYFDTAHSLFRHCTRGGMGPIWQIAIWQTKWHHIICWRMEIVDQVHVLECFRYKCKLIANCRLQKHTNSYIYWAKPTYGQAFTSYFFQTCSKLITKERSHGDPLVGDVKNDFVPAPKRRWVRSNE